MIGIRKERQLERDMEKGVMKPVSLNDIEAAALGAEGRRLVWKAGVEPTNVSFMEAVSGREKLDRVCLQLETQIQQPNISDEPVGTRRKRALLSFVNGVSKSPSVREGVIERGANNVVTNIEENLRKKGF